MKVVKDGKELEVTEKAYNVVYAPLGYTPIKEGGTSGQGRRKKATTNKNNEA